MGLSVHIGQKRRQVVCMLLPTHRITLFGFSLIELLLVISIIGMLMGIAVASFNSGNEKQQISQAAQNVKNILFESFFR